MDLFIPLYIAVNVVPAVNSGNVLSGVILIVWIVKYEDGDLQRHGVNGERSILYKQITVLWPYLVNLGKAGKHQFIIIDPVFPEPVFSCFSDSLTSLIFS